MMRLHPFKTVCMISVLTVALIIIGIAYVQAQGKGKGSWRAKILPGENLVGWPDPGEVYISGQDGVNIQNGKGLCGSGQDRTFYSYIVFEIYLPSQVLFQNLVFNLGGGSDGDLEICKFPTGGGIWPDCLAAFLSLPQPYEAPSNEASYSKVRFSFHTQTCPDLESFNFLDMEVGTIKTMSLRLYIIGQDTRDCDGCNELYNHNIVAVAHGWKPDDENPDIYIKRNSTNVWTVVVNTIFDNPAYKENWPEPYDYMNLRDQIFEQYCVCTQPLKGKGRQKQEFLEPGWTKAHLDFQIQFTKR